MVVLIRERGKEKEGKDRIRIDCLMRFTMVVVVVVVVVMMMMMTMMMMMMMMMPSR